MSKRATLYMVAGIICAVGAVLLAKKYLLGKNTPDPTANTTPILLASKEITYGTPFTLPDSEREAEGNVTFVHWPNKFVPEGAVTEEGLEEFQSKPYVAGREYIKHEPILVGALKTEADIVPRGMYRVGFEVESERVAAAGDRVDIWKVEEGEEPVLLVRCARVHTVETPRGESEEKKEGNNEQPAKPTLYVLVPEKLRDPVDHAKGNYHLRIRLSISSCEGREAELVKPQEVIEAEKAAEALKNAEQLFLAGRFQEALVAYRMIVDKYPTRPEAEKAAKRIKESVEALAKDRLKELRNMADRGDHKGVIEAAADIERDYPSVESVVREARRLARTAEAAMQAGKRETEYRALVTELDKAYKGGDIPECKKLLLKLQKEYIDVPYDPPAPLMGPEEVYKRKHQKVNALDMEFKMAKKVFEYVKNDRADAVKRFRQLKKKYPEHPYIEEAAQELRQKGWLIDGTGGNGENG